MLLYSFDLLCAGNYHMPGCSTRPDPPCIPMFWSKVTLIGRLHWWYRMYLVIASWYPNGNNFLGRCSVARKALAKIHEQNPLEMLRMDDYGGTKVDISLIFNSLTDYYYNYVPASCSSCHQNSPSLWKISHKFLFLTLHFFLTTVLRFYICDTRVSVSSERYSTNNLPPHPETCSLPKLQNYQRVQGNEPRRQRDRKKDKLAMTLASFASPVCSPVSIARASLPITYPPSFPYFRQTFIDFSRYTNPPSGNISHWRFHWHAVADLGGIVTTRHRQKTGRRSYVGRRGHVCETHTSHTLLAPCEFLLALFFLCRKSSWVELLLDTAFRCTRVLGRRPSLFRLMWQ